jgi:PPK2 family polyphosphate:nucleotide phosphotransferase
MNHLKLSLPEAIERCGRFAAPYRVSDGKEFRLKDISPDDTGDLTAEDKPEAKEALASGSELLTGLQERLYAQDRWAVLLIFQAMDAAGKDSAIKHVMSGVNPQGCQVSAFKAPSAEDLDHDYLWRCLRRLPERGRIGIFNRSHYEEVLIVRVHPEILRANRLPDKASADRHIWKRRYQSIVDHERHLHRNGTRIVKFFLHVSKEEQRKRFLARIDDPKKNWKFSASDAAERALWKDYMRAYEDCLAATSTDQSPWYAVPADDKPNARLIVSAAVLETMNSLKMRYPTPGPERIKELQRIRKTLLKT